MKMKISTIISKINGFPLNMQKKESLKSKEKVITKDITIGKNICMNPQKDNLNFTVQPKQFLFVDIVTLSKD